MAKCLLDHCEFAWGGQCVLVCPKGLGARTGKQEAAKEIEDFVRTLTRIKIARYGKQQQPTQSGVCRSRGVYHCYINYKKKQYYLGVYKDEEEADRVSAEAKEAKELGRFDDWLKKHREKAGIKKRAQKTQDKRV